MNQQTKFYKNSARSKDPTPEHKPYVPQYQVMGIEPEPYISPLDQNQTPHHTPVVLRGAPREPLPLDNPRGRKVGMRNMPYAETSVSPVGRGRGPVPNVGNNMEHTWSSVDSEIIDDVSGLSIDQTHHMVDNNDFVSDEALGVQTNVQTSSLGGKVRIEGEEDKAYLTENDLKKILSDKKEITSLSLLKDNHYMAILFDKVVATGPIDKVQAIVSSLIFGEHKDYQNVSISIDDIVVVKKIKLKVGVFLE